MTLKSHLLRLAFVTCGVLVVGLGCGSSTMPHGDAGGTLRSGPQVAPVGRAEVEIMQARLSRLHDLTQEALDAAALIGTTDRELSAAQQALATAKQIWQEGHHAFEAGRYQASWEKLVLAEAAFRRAEGQAIHAGLTHIDAELARVYHYVPVVEAQRSRLQREVVRVVGEIINLREGAGLDYQVIGKARMGEILQILAEEEAWYRVRTEQGTVGWVSKALVVRMD